MFMEVKNSFLSVHNYLESCHAKLMEGLLWLFFVGNWNAELQVGWVNYQLHREEIGTEQDVVCDNVIFGQAPMNSVRASLLGLKTLL